MSESRRWDAEPVTITVAPSGAEVTREHNPAVPYARAEIAAQTAAAYEAGMDDRDRRPCGPRECVLDAVAYLA